MTRGLTPPRRGRTAERLFVVFALMVLSGAFIPLLQRKAGVELDVTEGDRTTQLLLLPIYLVSAAWVATHLRRFGEVAMRHLPSLLLIGVALASVTWSAAPGITIRRSVALLATTLFAIYLAARFSTVELLQLLAWTLGLSAVFSLVAAVVLPYYGVSRGLHPGDWRGIYADKNVLGRLMVLSTVTFLLLAKARPARWWVLWPGALLSAGLVLRSRSGTALTVFASLLVLLPFFAALRTRPRVLPLIMMMSVLAGCAVVMAVAAEWQTTLHALGKDTSLSGRTTLWTAVLDRIAQRPWLGYGYSAFWIGWNGESAEVWRAVAWDPPHAHNGFLDLWLDLGLAGLLTLLAGLALSMRRAVATVRATRTADGLWPLTVVAFVALYNLTESALLKQNSIFWVLYAATVFSAASRSVVGAAVKGTAGRAADGHRGDAGLGRWAPGGRPVGTAVSGLSFGVRVRIAWTGTASSFRRRRVS